MAKGSTAGVEAQQSFPAELQRGLHFVSQVKGGVGKSVVASWLAQYFQSRERPAVCYDADSGNKTFHRMRGLEVRPLDLVVDGEINTRVYDQLMEEVLGKPGPFVVDTGAEGGFLSLWNYIAKNDLFSILAQFNKACVVHVPMAAVPDLTDTLEGFARICALSPLRPVIVVWLNQRERKIEKDGKSFLDLEIVEKHQAKLLGVVVNSRQLYSLHREAVGKMLAQAWTFAEGIEQFPAMEKIRLIHVRDEVFEQLEKLGL